MIDNMPEYFREQANAGLIAEKLIQKIVGKTGPPVSFKLLFSWRALMSMTHRFIRRLHYELSSKEKEHREITNKVLAGQS